MESDKFNFRQTQQGTGLRDLEERQRILKDRILLIGKNLIEFKEENNKKILELKKELDIIKSDVKRMIEFLELSSNEFSKFARKEDLLVLSKQAKMFQPLNLVTKQEVKRMIQEELNK